MITGFIDKTKYLILFEPEKLIWHDLLTDYPLLLWIKTLDFPRQAHH
jgi:hypothetical protein